jgi:hypothetical protein
MPRDFFYLLNIFSGLCGQEYYYAAAIVKISS